MTTSWILAFLHLVALVGLGAVFIRGYVLHNITEEKALRNVFFADSLWGIAAILWIVTGLLRAFGGFAKGSAYYLHSSSFWIKMALLVLILILEIWPMITLIRWRVQLRKGKSINLSPARRIAHISHVQGLLIILMVLAATAMARGINL